MSERHLALVLDTEGEVLSSEEVCPDCAAKTQAIERLTRSYEKTIQNLREQLEEKRQAEREADPTVEWVVSDWCDRAHASGWWSVRPKATEPRRDTVRSALNRKLEPAYLVLVHKGAFWQAQFRKNDRRFSRSWLEPATLYGKFIDAYAETALDPQNERVRQMLDAPARMFTRWARVVEQCDVCDCGHWRLDHSHAGDGSSPCGVHGCHCVDFDDFHLQADRWSA